MTDGYSDWFNKAYEKELNEKRGSDWQLIYMNMPLPPEPEWRINQNNGKIQYHLYPDRIWRDYEDKRFILRFEPPENLFDE